MSSARSAERTRRANVALRHAVVVALLCCGASNAYAQSTIVRVEEDWELVVDQPDPDSHSPQVTTTISPYDHVNSIYAAVELNHQSLPEFAAGGVSLQVWNGEQPLATCRSDRESLHHDAETVCWTQRMRLYDGQLVFKVVNGTSTSWGSFGGDELRASLQTTLTNLSGYNPAVSVAKSSVGYAANRVERLVLKEVRYYTTEGLLSSDTTQRVVYQR